MPLGYQEFWIEIIFVNTLINLNANSFTTQERENCDLEKN